MVARQPVRYIVGSVTCAVVLSYPFFLLNAIPSPGISSVPHHVWSSARQFNSVGVDPDIAIRQAWVQGSYMGALKLEVVEEALKIQQTLLGPDISCTTRPEGDSLTNIPPGVFFHSPLLYWNCSLSSIQQDSDLLGTVNANAMRVSPLNMTLHWSSVFAGKLFSHHRLAAADALVISVFYNPKSNMGDIWDQRATALAIEAKTYGKYDIYPPNGKARRNTFYEVWET